MAIERRRTYSRLDDEQLLQGETYYRITKSISFKSPQVKQTIATWKPAKKQKSFRQRCTRSETGGFCMTNFGILTVAVLFCYCIPRNLFVGKDDIGNPQGLSDNPARMIVFALALTSSSMSLLSLWLTYVTDPGVIPRRSEIEIRLLNEGERHCQECKIIRPKRGKHCRHCNHCVEVFDHHCPYAGVCIGNGNYLFFCLLLLSGMISSTYVSFFSIWFLKDNWPAGDKTWDQLRFELIVAVVLTVICGLIFLLIGHLSLYHVFIVVTGQTTNEWVKTKRSKKSLKAITALDTPSKEPLLGSRLSQETTDWRNSRYSITDTKASYTQFGDQTTTENSRFADL